MKNYCDKMEKLIKQNIQQYHKSIFLKKTFSSKVKNPLFFFSMNDSF